MGDRCLQQFWTVSKYAGRVAPAGQCADLYTSALTCGNNKPGLCTCARRTRAHKCLKATSAGFLLAGFLLARFLLAGFLLTGFLLAGFLLAVSSTLHMNNCNSAGFLLAGPLPPT